MRSQKVGTAPVDVGGKIERFQSIAEIVLSGKRHALVKHASGVGLQSARMRDRTQGSVFIWQRRIGYLPDSFYTAVILNAAACGNRRRFRFPCVVFFMDEDRC